MTEEQIEKFRQSVMILIADTENVVERRQTAQLLIDITADVFEMKEEDLH